VNVADGPAKVTGWEIPAAPGDPLHQACAAYPCDRLGDTVVVSFNGDVIELCEGHARSTADHLS
jgi:hypothetical protein